MRHFGGRSGDATIQCRSEWILRMGSILDVEIGAGGPGLAPLPIFEIHIVEWSGVEWSGVEWSGVGWGGVGWSGVGWGGVEWSGVERRGAAWRFPILSCTSLPAISIQT